jgi:hypothetical protein
MKNQIIILPEINLNVNLASHINKACEEIVTYFGKKSAKYVPNQPIVEITCDITQDDIDAIEKEIDLECITLIAFLGNESTSERVNGSIIDLR